MKKVLAVLAALAAFIVFGPVAPAQAATCVANSATYGCGVIRHAASGGNGHVIGYRCDYGTGPSHQLSRGQTSKSVCVDTDEVYVYAGQEIWCYESNGDSPGSYQLNFDANGWHKINGLFQKTCISKAD